MSKFFKAVLPDLFETLPDFFEFFMGKGVCLGVVAPVTGKRQIVKIIVIVRCGRVYPLKFKMSASLGQVFVDELSAGNEPIYFRFGYAAIAAFFFLLFVPCVEFLDWPGDFLRLWAGKCIGL
jgi:hypothetical protein